MKRCPKCSQTYTDEALNFCLDDGEWLVENESPTAILHSTDALGEAPTRIQSTLAAPTAPGNAVSKRNWIFAAVLGVLAVVALGVGGYWIYGGSKAIRSIAVLPFENRSGDPDNDYLSEQLAESLIYRLIQLPDLKVSPASAVFRYKGKEVDPQKVGGELGVGAVMTGRIAQRGDNLTISVELVDVSNGKVIWGEQFDRKTSELLNTQRQIAREIVEHLKIGVSAQETGLSKHYTESNEAYQLYMKGRFHWNKRTREAMQRSVEFYKQAIEADPNFALAYSGLADTYNLISAPEAGGGGEPANDALPKAKAAALKAIEIDPILAEGHVSLAHSLYYFDRDFAGAEREFRKAIDLNPKYSVAHHWYAIYLTVVGRYPEANAEMKHAQELDPFSMAIGSWVGWTYYLSDDNEQALDQLLKTKEMDPNFLLTRYRLAFVYADLNMFNEAIAEAGHVQRLSNGKLATVALAYTYAKAGRRSEALEQVDLLIDAAKQRLVPPASIGRIYALLGDKDQAMKWLEKANDERDLQAVWIKHDRRLGNLRDDPRFLHLVKRIGTP
jgi:TolB-like protein/Flp pilus assembly protein TadD